MSEEISKAEAMMLAPIRLHVGGWLSTKYTLERCRPCLFTRILLAFVHLLLELLGLLLADEGEPCKAIFKLKGMKESTVLVVIEWIVDFLIPDYSSVGALYKASQLFEYCCGAGERTLPICRPF